MLVGTFNFNLMELLPLTERKITEISKASN